MNSLHRDVLYKLFEFIPDVRAFSCVCKWSDAETTGHPDMLYWRGGDTREQFLTTKIYAEFKCANTSNLIKYDRADLFAAHNGQNGAQQRLDTILMYDARKIIEQVAQEHRVLPIHHHIDHIRTREQYQFLESRFTIVGVSSAVYETVCSGNVEILAEFGRSSPEIREQVASLALRNGSRRTVTRLIAADIIEPRRAHLYAIDDKKYWLIDILYCAGKGLVVPEDITGSVIAEMTPDGLTALAAAQDISDHLKVVFDTVTLSFLKLVPAALRLGATPNAAAAADYVDYAAKNGDLAALLALRMYIKNNNM